MASEQKILSNLGNPYFSEDNFVLYHGDSLELLSKLPENSIDMIFADPPYNLSNGGFTVHAGRRVSVNKGNWDRSKGLDADFDFHQRWIEACRRVLKPHGTIWISGTYHSIYQCGFALQKSGCHILNDISWFKPNASPNLSCRFFTASHETLLWARKNKKARHTFNYRTMVGWENNYRKKIKCAHCKTDDFYEILHEKGKQMRSVWALGTPHAWEKHFGKHPTQKPLDLLRHVVLASTNKGDIVLDPFTGSSTTGLAAYIDGRKFVGMDTEKEYLELSKKRFRELKTKVN